MEYNDMLMHHSYRWLVGPNEDSDSPNDDSDLSSTSLPDDDLEDDEADSLSLPDSDDDEADVDD